MNALYIILLAFGAQATVAAVAMFAWIIRIGATATPPVRVVVATTPEHVPGAGRRATATATLRVLEHTAPALRPSDDGERLAA